MKLYALHDKKAKSFSTFHVQPSDVSASRGFVEAVLAEGSLFGKYPDDFELVSLCDVSQAYEDLSSAVVVGLQAFTVVLTAAQVLASQPRSDSQLSLLKEA